MMPETVPESPHPLFYFKYSLYLCGMKNNEEKMTRLIEHEGVWRKIGDLIQIKEKRSFLFWYLPFFKTVTYQIDFIGLDCSALLKNPKTKELRTITGNVNVL
jgi:hypothetical protein